MRATCGVLSARRPSVRPLQLVDQLEGLQVERLAGAGEQRLDVLEQRRHHQLEAVAARRRRAGRAGALRCGGPAQAGHRRCAPAGARQRTCENAGVLKTGLYRAQASARPLARQARRTAASIARPHEHAAQAEEADLAVAHLQRAARRCGATTAGSGTAAGLRRSASARTAPSATSQNAGARQRADFLRGAAPAPAPDRRAAP